MHFVSPRSRWNITQSDTKITEMLQRELGVSHMVATLMAKRNISELDHAKRYLNPGVHNLPDPMLLPDALKACERIRTALKNKEKILVHGDYDGDGVTSAALWTRLLRRLGGDVEVIVPHRGRDGYDMRSPVVARAVQMGVTLIVTSDCGIQRVDEVDEARTHKIDVVITDHHEPGLKLPDAAAVVNPHRKDSIYPYENLAGVGVAYRLGEALVAYMGLNVDSYRRAYADLAAIGTVTDRMPLTGDNRDIVHFGLQCLSGTKKAGLKALLKQCQVEGPVTVQTLGFGVGPRLNAAGRVDETLPALDILLTEHDEIAESLASLLTQRNTERKEIQKAVIHEAEAQALSMLPQKMLVLVGNTWPSGVIGLAAGKICQTYNRPCVLIAVDNTLGTARGSARSIETFQMLDALIECKDLLLEFGGHAFAAGFSIDPKNVDLLRKRLNEIADKQLTPEDLIPTTNIDYAIELDQLDAPLMRDLERLAPYGAGNPSPVLLSTEAKLAGWSIMGKEKEHLKMQFSACRLKDGIVEAPVWGAAKSAKELMMNDRFDICFSPDVNRFNGSERIQLQIEDIAKSANSQPEL